MISADPLTLALHEHRPDGLRLTRREQQIAALLADGHTNQQIADTLVISRRTVENHLQSIYRKAGVTNRTAAAAAIGADDAR